MFQVKRHGMFQFDHSNAPKVFTEWTLHQDHMLLVCLSLHGTSRCDDIAKYSIFSGFEQRHLHSRTKHLLRFHSIKPLQRYRYDAYLIRNYFMDAERVALDGFVLNKHNCYWHPTMTDAEKVVFFLQFQLTESRKRIFERLRDQLNILVWNQPDVRRHTTIEIVAMLWELEQ